MCPTLCDSMDCSPPGFFVHRDSPGKNTGVSCHALFQGILPTQGLNPGLPHCRQILSGLSHQGSPRILEWVVYPFSRGSSWPGNRTGVSCITSESFTNWGPGKPMTNLDSLLKSRDNTSLTEVHIGKAMVFPVFPVVMYRYESWTIQNAELWRTNVLYYGAGEDSWESLGLQDQTRQF